MEIRIFAKCFSLIATFCLALAPLVSCALTPRREEMPYTAPARSSRVVEVLDYQGREDGLELEDWLSVYIVGGVLALEKLAEFAPYYVFVVEQYSSNLDTLTQWADNFSVEHDFPQLVFLRVYDRLTGNISAIPDDLYGSFFETMIKRT
ncbi:MAG: hypothetical protein LBH18_05030, partial [Spirochaetaceae bacterium]|nr:hypothetical protein [Spirochaetaceae bacterium]